MELSKSIFMVIDPITKLCLYNISFLSLTCFCLLGHSTRKRGIGWIQRLEIAEDTARGMSIPVQVCYTTDCEW